MHPQTRWLLVGLAISSLELAASAQSYVGPPNTIGASVAYDYLRVKGFYSQCGDEYGRCFDEYTYTVHQMTFGAEYSTPVEGLAASAQLNVLNPNETGATAAVPGIQDEGFETTDFRMDVRYALPMQPAQFRIAPAIGFTYPTDYSVEPGFHAAYGKKLKQLHLGINVGRNLVSDLYFDFNYTFTFSERPDEHPYDDPTLPTLADIGVKAPHRSDARLDFGYFILPQLSA